MKPGRSWWGGVTFTALVMGAVVTTLTAASSSRGASTTGTQRALASDAGASLPFGTSWFPTEFVLDGGAVNDEFGLAVCFSGGSILVSAPFRTVGSNAQEGLVYEYTESDGGWAQSPNTLSEGDGGAAYDAFGARIACDGPLALIGAPGANDGAGVVHVYQSVNGSWVHVAALPGQPNDNYGGFGLSLAQGIAVVGAPGRNSTGAVDVYTQSGSAFGAVPTEIASPFNGGYFGWSVSNAGPALMISVLPSLDAIEWSATVPYDLSGGVATQDTIIQNVDRGSASSAMMPGIAAVSNDGYADVYTRSGSSGDWTLLSHVAGNGDCGMATAMSSNEIAIGCGDSVLVYPYDPATSAWQPSEVPLRPLDPYNFNDYFGYSVAVSGTTLAIGAPGTSFGPPAGQNQGAFYVETLAPANGNPCVTLRDCGSGYCVDGVCCDTSCTGPCAQCTSGSCLPKLEGSPASPSCGNYSCDGVDTGCPTQCVRSADCASSYFCHGGACVSQSAPGGTCQSNDQCTSGVCSDSGVCLGTSANGTDCAGTPWTCASGFCVDGVCCDTPCDGECQACDVAPVLGTCSLVSSPQGTRSCGSGVCAGTCQGATAQCTYPTDTVGETCDDAGVNLITRVCNGLGQEVDQPHPCDGQLVCNPDAGSCLTACATWSDCVPGFSCDLDSGTCFAGGSRCVAGENESQSVQDAGGDGVTSCGSYVCNELTGACRTDCVTVADCTGDNVCDPVSKHCVVEPATGAQVPSSCACSAAGAPAPLGSTALGGVVGALALLARRRRFLRRGRLRR